MPCDTFVSVKQVRAFTIYGHWVPVENAHLLRLVAQFGKHGDLSLTALTQHLFLDPVGYILGRVDLGCQRTPCGRASHAAALLSRGLPNFRVRAPPDTRAGPRDRCPPYCPLPTLHLFLRPISLQ